MSWRLISMDEKELLYIMLHTNEDFSINQTLKEFKKKVDKWYKEWGDVICQKI